MQRRLNALSDYLSSRKLTESNLKSVERLKSSVNIDRDAASHAISTLENVSPPSCILLLNEKRH
jgi:hypothetical protein